MNNTKRISGPEIIRALVDLKQLVFEVTDACNLKCKYCGYGDLYFGFEKRETNYLDISRGKALVDYLVNIWDNNKTRAKKQLTYISFYGGEPLLNVPYIKEMVEYIESQSINRQFVFSMTTNGTLLNRYMDYLVDKGFKLLISLDGKGEQNGYRVTASGHSSFEKVFNNVKELQRRYPDYFKHNVSFNTVLHNKNDVESVTDFIKMEFDKVPTIAELNNSHVRPDKKEEFDKLYKNKIKSLYHESSDMKSLSDKLFLEDPRTNSLMHFLREYSGNIFDDYEALLKDPGQCKICPTGTCMPFSRKMFLTVHGKILQCERIDHEYALGLVDDNNRVILDLEAIAKRINEYYDKLQSRCSICAKKTHCSQCMYYIEDLQSERPLCHAFMSQEEFRTEQSIISSYLHEKPELYSKIMNDVILD